MLWFVGVDFSLVLVLVGYSIGLLHLLLGLLRLGRSARAALIAGGLLCWCVGLLFGWAICVSCGLALRGCCDIVICGSCVCVWLVCLRFAWLLVCDCGSSWVFGWVLNLLLFAV